MIKKIIKLILFGFIFFVMGCFQNEFESSCIKSVEILVNANKLIKSTDSQDIIINGKVEFIQQNYDTTEATNYIRQRENELLKNYEIIKSQLNNVSNKDYYDALFTIALINKMVYLITGQQIDEFAKYSEIIRKESNVELSEWIMDYVLGPSMNNKDRLNEWLRMNYNDKYKDIYSFLLVPVEFNFTGDGATGQKVEK